MKLLLDTCTFLWAISDNTKLSESALEALESTENELYLSSVSSWEIALKYRIGKLELKEAPGTLVPRTRRDLGAEPLVLSEEAALHTARIQGIHSDPFDRLLVSQALVDGLVIVTPDEQIQQYPVRYLW